MSKVQTSSKAALPPATFAALVAGALAIGAMATGWITIKRLRFFSSLSANGQH